MGLAPFFPAAAQTTVAGTPSAAATDSIGNNNQENLIRKVLIVGDSMTGWMAERLNAYGVKDGFEVATVVWDGSTIRKWGASPRLAQIIAEQKPDVVFISLGMNELFESNPQKTLGESLDHIVAAMGETPYIWIGPPSWPGHDDGRILVDWLASRLGPHKFFNSFNLDLARQSKTNPHPSRAGIIEWVDDFVEWLPANSELHFPPLDAPAANAMSRGKVFIYKRMKEQL